jgi:hypothetical protein
MKKIHVKEIVGVNAISMQSGSYLYEVLSTSILKKGESIELDFSGVELFASPFFNSSIGLLLKDINIDALQEMLKVTNLSKVGLQLLNHVIENAIKFYANKSISSDHESIADKHND